MARTRQKKYTHKKRGNNRKTRRQRKSSRKTLLRKRVGGGIYLKIGYENLKAVSKS